MHAAADINLLRHHSVCCFESLETLQKALTVGVRLAEDRFHFRQTLQRKPCVRHCHDVVHTPIEHDLINKKNKEPVSGIHTHTHTHTHTQEQHTSVCMYMHISAHRPRSSSATTPENTNSTGWAPKTSQIPRQGPTFAPGPTTGTNQPTKKPINQRVRTYPRHAAR